jgi:nickel/cobalt transporter (NicO) family protein
MKIASCLSVVLALHLLPAAHAHPVPRRNHDRTIVVRLGTDSKDRVLAVQVHYRLEVDEFTALYQDLLGLGQKVDFSKLNSPQEIYETYTETYAPILAGNLTADVDARALQFVCSKRTHSLRDENGTPLGHLRCDFVFSARLQDITAGRTVHRFRFREGNYEFEEGLIRVTLVSDESVRLSNKTEADEALRSRPFIQWQPGDEAKLRTVAADLNLLGAKSSTPSQSASTPKTDEQVDEEAGAGKNTLLALLLDSQQGFWVLMLLAAGFGAAHALTPGHGKTLVAAYLVGERGTFGHALVLGLVTTLTHTGAVLLLAALLLFFFPHAVPRDIQLSLGLVGGLLVAGMGVWLSLRRLAGGADHFHLGGHGHHDRADPHQVDHNHDQQGHAHLSPNVSAGDGWWGLVVLGISGGIVPCWDAILMLGFAISAQRLWLGIPLLLAFSAGLAGILILIGIAVVYLKGFASSRWSENRLVRALPIISALLITCLGLGLCYDSLHPRVAPAESTVRSQP